MQYTLAVGEKVFHYSDVDALSAARFLAKAQKYISPMIDAFMKALPKDAEGKSKELAKGEEGRSILDMDINLSEMFSPLNEGVIDDVILPLFALAKVSVDTGDGVQRPLSEEAQIKFAFPSVADLVDLGEVAFTVAKMVGAPFFDRLLNRIGSQPPEERKPPITRRLAK